MVCIYSDLDSMITLLLSPQKNIIFAAKCIHLYYLFTRDYFAIEPDYNPALSGSNVTFTCKNSSGLILAGHNTSQCMDNGEWEPDPRNIRCKGN